MIDKFLKDNLSSIGIASTVLAVSFWVYPTITKTNIFAETKVCFRPKQVLNQENEYLLKCNSNERTGVILTSVFNDLNKNDSEWSDKVAKDSFTKHFDSSINNVRYNQLASILFATAGIVAFGYDKKQLKQNRGAAYQNKRLELVENEAGVYQKLYGYDAHTPALKRQLQNKTFIRDCAKLEREAAEEDVLTAKARKEISKLTQSNCVKNTPASSNTVLINSMIEALKAHESGWLWYLVESFTPIIIWGKAGSYKSYTAATIALLKHYLIDAKIESIADIDFEQNREASWKYLVPLEPGVYGNGIDWESYNEGYLAAIERSKTRTLKNKPIVSIWDELTNANGQFENASKIVPWVIATPRKRNEHTILLTHNLTQGCLGGCEKISDAIHSQTYRLNLKTSPDAKPLFKGVLEGLVDAGGDELPEHKVSLPAWFRPEIIHGHFNGSPIEF